ncbi:MAG: histidine phosphatase family protein [Gordonia amarae]
MELLLIRHARPHHIVDPSGADPALDPDGQEQAQLLAKALRGGRHGEIHRLVSSPMRRARQTAEFVRSTLSLPVEFDDRIAELDRGWTTYGVNLDAYPTRSLLFQDMNSGRLGENTFDPDAFRERAVAGVEDIVTAADDDSRVAVVCHGGVINAYLAHILGTDRLFFTFPTYTSVTRVHAHGDELRELLSVNEADHLH